MYNFVHWKQKDIGFSQLRALGKHFPNSIISDDVTKNCLCQGKYINIFWKGLSWSAYVHTTPHFKISPNYWLKGSLIIFINHEGERRTSMRNVILTRIERERRACQGSEKSLHKVNGEKFYLLLSKVGTTD